MIYKFLHTIYSVLLKDIQIASKYKFNIILSIVNVLIYLFIIFQIDKSFIFFADNVDGEYDKNLFLFLLIGLIAIEITIVCSNAIPLNINFYQTSGMIEELISPKNSFLFICIGSALYPFLRSCLKIFFFFLFGVTLFQLEFNFKVYQLLFFYLLLVYLISLIGIGLMAGAFTVFYKRGNPIIQINALVTTLLGGALFPTYSLNPSIQSFIDLIPGKHFIDLSRSIFDNSASLASLEIYQILYLTLISIFLLFLGVIFLKISINQAIKRDRILSY